MNTRIDAFDQSKYDDNFKKLKEIRKQLNDHVNCLNEPLEVNDESITLHDIIWQDVKNKIIFKDPIKQDFLKEAKSLDIEIIDRAKRELLKPKLDQYGKTCRKLIEANFFEITHKKDVPETEGELDSLTKKSNSALTQYSNLTNAQNKLIEAMKPNGGDRFWQLVAEFGANLAASDSPNFMQAAGQAMQQTLAEAKDMKKEDRQMLIDQAKVAVDLEFKRGLNAFSFQQYATSVNRRAMRTSNRDPNSSHGSHQNDQKWHS